MFPIFDCERVRDMLKDGRIYRTGVFWREQDLDGVQGMAVKVVVIGLELTVTWWLFSIGQYGMGILTALLWPAAGFAFWIYAPGEECGVLFNRDGTIETPHGYVQNKRRRSVGAHHDEVISIEAVKKSRSNNGPDHYQVRMLLSEGDLIILSERIYERPALKVAAQLSLALEELREKLGHEFRPSLGLEDGESSRLIR